MVVLLLILAIICGLLATAGVPAGRVNLFALSFVLYLVSVLVPIVDGAT